ncbi:MAG: DNA-binding protein [Candidatus Omnitrophota bacterium]
MKILFNVKCVMCNVFLLYALHFTLYTAYAQPISSTELINNAKIYNSKTVTYEGEIIGDVMRRGENAWINVNDGSNAIGIWINTSLLKEINYTGSYKSSGDRVEVTGVFNRACPEHGGDLDIHAQSLRKINSGRLRPQRLNPDKRNQVFILLGVLISVWILSLLKRK